MLRLGGLTCCICESCSWGKHFKKICGIGPGGRSKHIPEARKTSGANFEGHTAWVWKKTTSRGEHYSKKLNACPYSMINVSSFVWRTMGDQINARFVENVPDKSCLLEKNANTPHLGRLVRKVDVQRWCKACLETAQQTAPDWLIGPKSNSEHKEKNKEPNRNRWGGGREIEIN